MKKFFKKNLKMILVAGVTAIICVTGTVFAAYQYNAKQVEYKDGKSVEDVLNELYSRKKEPFVWLNSNKIDTGTIECDISKYTKAVIFCEYSSDGQWTGTTSSKIVDIELNKTINMTGMNTSRELNYSKPITFKENSIEIGTGTYTGVITGSGCGCVNGIILY